MQKQSRSFKCTERTDIINRRSQVVRYKRNGMSECGEQAGTTPSEMLEKHADLFRARKLLRNILDNSNDDDEALEQKQTATTEAELRALQLQSDTFAAECSKYVKKIKTLENCVESLQFQISELLLVCTEKVRVNPSTRSTCPTELSELKEQRDLARAQWQTTTSENCFLRYSNAQKKLQHYISSAEKDTK